MENMEKYIAVKENPAKVTHLKVQLYYSLGGMNYFTYKTEPRGYYLSVSPVERSRGMESYTAFSGVKNLIIEVKRQSAKKEAEAEKMAESMLKSLIDYVCRKESLEIAE